MVQFRKSNKTVDGLQDLYEILIPFQGSKKKVKYRDFYQGSRDIKVVGYIDAGNNIHLSKSLHVNTVRNILLHWEEYEFQRARNIENALSNNKQKGE